MGEPPWWKGWDSGTGRVYLKVQVWEDGRYQWWEEEGVMLANQVPDLAKALGLSQAQTYSSLETCPAHLCVSMGQTGVGLIQMYLDFMKCLYVATCINPAYNVCIPCCQVKLKCLL